MNKTVGIIGAGQLGLQIANHAINDNHYIDVVFFDDYATERKIKGYPIIGKTASIAFEYEKGTFDELLIGIGYSHLEVRKKFYDQFCDQIPFGKIIHSTSWVDKTAVINKGCVIYPHCCVDKNVDIQANTIINLGTVIAHDTTVGKHCFLSVKVSLAGFVSIDEQCFLGINTTLIDHVKLGSQIHLGAGTVVIKNLDKSGLYVGNPHRFVRPIR